MRTTDLIETLAADATLEPNGVGRRMLALLPASVAIVAGSFLCTLGLRADICEPAVLAALGMKLAITLALAVTGLVLTLRLARPARVGGRALLALIVPLGLLIAALVVELDQIGATGWQQRLIGTNHWRCLVAVPLLSALPLAALIVALRRGAVTELRLAGAFAGIGAAGIGASVYALYCFDDSPLFVALWYGLATCIVAGIGMLAAQRFVRW